MRCVRQGFPPTKAGCSRMHATLRHTDQVGREACGSRGGDAMTRAERFVRVAAWTDERRFAWSERAAIIEFDGGHAREDAERLAFEQIVGAQLALAPQTTAAQR